MKKAPTPSTASGAYGEQLSFLPTPVLCPAMPRRTTKAWLALLDMTRAPITQIDWILMGRGWRLAAAIKALRYAGWQIVADWVYPSCSPAPIKRYTLAVEDLRIAQIALKGAK